MKKTRLVAAAGLAGLLLSTMSGIATAGLSADRYEGEGEGLKLIKTLDTGTGTDAEVRKINGRDYVFATSRSPLAEGGGVHVIDVTNPAKAKVVATVPCVVSQGDLQTSHDMKTLMLAHDSAGGPESCTGLGKVGFITIDIRNPLKPKVLGHADTNGSHNITAHPTKPYVYNSTSKLAPPGDIQIWSIKNPAKPVLVNTVRSLPHAPHDISFDKKGNYAVTAAISHFDIFDTSDPENPSLVYSSQCPGCSITHDAKFTPDGKHVLIGDEGGGGGTYVCPGGAWYVYDFTVPPVPVLTGVYEPNEFVTSRSFEGQPGPGNLPNGCTSHVFDISDDSTKIAISWYTVGTRYLDITSAIGPTV